MTIILQAHPEDIQKIRNSQMALLTTAFEDRLYGKTNIETEVKLTERNKESLAEKNITPQSWINSQAKKFKRVAITERLEDSFYQPRFKLLFERLLSKNKGKTRFLDLGCCDASVSKYIIRDLGFSHVFVADLPEVIAQIEPMDGLTLLPIDLNEESLECDFDIIYADEVIEHLYNDYLFLSRCYSHTKSGGLLYITAPQDPPVERWYEGGFTHSLLPRSYT